MRRIYYFIFIIFFSNANAYDFSKVDSIVLSGINYKFFPGASLIIANNNDIIYEKYYGKLTYDENSDFVNSKTLYDLASVTKVIATTSAIMKLVENEKLSLDDKVISYIPEFNNNGKEKITIYNLLLHNSGLKAWIPFYKYYKTKEEVLNAIYDVRLEYSTGSQFVYSDLNAILLGIIVEKVSGKSLDNYCSENIFEPMGLKNTTFIPGNEFYDFIAPTEYDNYWRKRQLHGEVHDEASSILGGVSGNAGLFSTAKDLKIFMQMMLNNGKYYNPKTRGLKEETLFQKETIELFTKKADNLKYSNTRALGWDTKQPPIGKNRSQCGELISENCFGHTGYTGTSVWCDKDRNLIIIFLTNRVYPSRESTGIREIRPDLHNEIVKQFNKK